ncbi:peptidoglycan-binding domain-containing protein [Streptomyces adustus]|uniref:peptidoglycan-binding domain-containing protein n=1 Tax=Streptomyces adustus TaxID=1609272 RepID=UPI0037177F71
MLPNVPEFVVLYAALLQHPAAADLDVSSLRLCVSGGASLPVEVLHGFERRFGCVILEGSASCPSEIVQGQKSGCVTELQSLLNHHGADLAVDGDFGPMTAGAVRDFQAEKGLSVDGKVGPNTKAALYGAVTRRRRPRPAAGTARCSMWPRPRSARSRAAPGRTVTARPWVSRCPPATTPGARPS